MYKIRLHPQNLKIRDHSGKKCQYSGNHFLDTESIKREQLFSNLGKIWINLNSTMITVDVT